MYVRKGVKYRASAPGQAPAYATGSLFRTIKVKLSNATKPNAKLVADGVYRLMEFGTRHQAPQPFMRPAWDAHKGRLVDDIGADMWVEIQKAVKRKAARDAKLAGV